MEEHNRKNDKFWVVSKPSKTWDLDFLSNYLTIEDICFCTCYRGLMTQTLGGLTPSDIVGVFVSEKPAKVCAEQILKQCIIEKTLEESKSKL